MIATGRQESVRCFIELKAQQVGWGPMQWDAKGTAEVGRRGDTGEVVIASILVIPFQRRWKTVGQLNQCQGKVGLDPVDHP